MATRTNSSVDLSELKETVALSHRLLYYTGLGTTRGHSSIRIPGTDRFIIKPWPHIQMHRVTADDLIIMGMDGNIVEGNGRQATRVSEWPIHAEIYRAHPDVGAVIHTHQKWASLVGIAGQSVLPVVGTEQAAAVAEPLPMFDEDKSLIRRVQQGRLVAECIGSAPACHLQNHGMVFAAPNLETATVEAIEIEYQAEMTWRAKLIGTPEAVPKVFLRPALDRRAAGGIPESWEHYWKWVDKHPESLRPRMADI